LCCKLRRQSVVIRKTAPHSENDPAEQPPSHFIGWIPVTVLSPEGNVHFEGNQQPTVQIVFHGLLAGFEFSPQWFAAVVRRNIEREWDRRRIGRAAFQPST